MIAAGDLGSFRIEWERHNEFVRFKFILTGLGRHPFEDPAIAAAPADWVAGLPGEVIAGEADEPVLLDRLTRLSAALDSQQARGRFRLSAAVAYDDLMQRRIRELREDRIQGLQTFREFTERRTAPATATCRSVSGRVESIAQRAARATQPLPTRVDVTREGQNQELLASMNRRVAVALGLRRICRIAHHEP